MLCLLNFGASRCTCVQTLIDRKGPENKDTKRYSDWMRIQRDEVNENWFYYVNVAEGLIGKQSEGEKKM